jgi:hypothetical protein
VAPPRAARAAPPVLRGAHASVRDGTALAKEGSVEGRSTETSTAKTSHLQEEPMKKHMLTAMTLISTLCAAACGSTGNASDQAEQPIVITAQDTARLPATKAMDLPLSTDTVYQFEDADGPIAFDRITLVANGSEIPLETLVAKMAEAKGVPAAGFHPGAFRVGLHRSEGSATRDRAAMCRGWIDDGERYIPYYYPCDVVGP